MRTPAALSVSIVTFLLVLTACSPDANRADLTGPPLVAAETGPQFLECGEEDEWGNIGQCVGCEVDGGLSVSAGGDQEVAAGALVTLYGEAYGIFGYCTESTPTQGTWSQTGGPSVQLSSTTTNSPTFTAPNTATVLTFRLTAWDISGTLSDDVTITVLPTIPQRFDDLAAMVGAANLEKNTAKSLLSLLKNVEASYDKGDTAGALDKLTSFIAQVSALKKKIPGQSELIDAASALITAISAA